MIELHRFFYEFIELTHLYESAVETVKTQLNIYDSEFSIKFKRNPIHSIESRVKSPQSILEKLQRKGLIPSAKSAQANLMDIAGVRVICYYIDDIYAILELLSMRDDYKIVKIKDYIKNPKPSGYRSLHVIVMIPVYLAASRHEIPVEIQVRHHCHGFLGNIGTSTALQNRCRCTPRTQDRTQGNCRYYL